MKDKLRLKNVSLKVQRKKLLLQLRQVCGFVFLSFFFFFKVTVVGRTTSSQKCPCLRIPKMSMS